MHRLIVALLAAVDAAIAVAVGIAATLAPLTLLWVFGLGGGADWGALWPASAAIWQFGNLVPLAVTIPADYIAAAGIDPDAASFTLSLAPLAFASFTVIFAARSGVRASRADAWATGVVASSSVFAILATIVALTSANGVAAVTVWQAVLLPTLVFALPAVVAAVVTEWREAGSGAVSRLRDRVEAAPHGWAEAPGLIARGGAVVVAGLAGLGALLVTVALVLRGGEIVALYEAAHVDVLGAIVITLAQLAYLPTLVVWGIAFVAGPGFAVGEGTSVSPAGTQAGVVPGIPLLGIVPDSTTPWLLLLALGPIALGALAGWIARSRLTGVGAPRDRKPGPADVVAASTDGAADPSRTSALAGLLAASATVVESEPEAAPDPERRGPAAPSDDPIGARVVVALGIAVVSAVGAALLAAVASGSLGPGRLATMGPTPGPVALAVGLEVVLGAAILLLSPMPRGRGRSHAEPSAAATGISTDGVTSERDAGVASVMADAAAEPAASGPFDEDGLQGAPARSLEDLASVEDRRDLEPADMARQEEPPEPEAQARPAEPRAPFTFPTLPRMPDPVRRSSEGRDDEDAPVD
ncbi:cell division protein PerM [Microbacterium pumilum]|uniref:Uncharacterized protein n=1 Tax=Microbacterium pumilum TaxID=344165 RepID=A0ABN2SBP8_9MICO